MRKRGTLHARRCGRQWQHMVETLRAASPTMATTANNHNRRCRWHGTRGRNGRVAAARPCYPSRVHCPPFPTVMPAHCRDVVHSVSNDGDSTNGATAPSCRPPSRHPGRRWRGWHRHDADCGKRLTRSLRYACTPFLSTAKEREERMPPLNPPSSRHAGAPDAGLPGGG